ncbi:MAG: aminotransferase class III-fold pyridoxal phosphate-dependent enzyme [Acidimicrobiia bacterium]
MAGLSPHLQQATGVTAVRGEGCHLFDAAGRRYLDFTSGIGVTSTGHCHPAVVEAVRRQAGTLIHGQYTTVVHPGLLELTRRLGEVCPGAIDTFFYASAGTEAVEAAVKLAKQATGRTNVIAFQGGFHGRSTGSLSMTTSKVAYRAGLQPMMGGVFVAPFPYRYRYGWDDDETVEFCLRELDYLFATQTAPAETAAIVVEPVLGEGGYVPAPDAFLRGLRARCTEHGIVFVVDEVQTGFGRTGTYWGLDPAGVEPDVVTIAKGLASGFPLSAMGAAAELMAKAWPGSQGGTYGGNAVSCAAALATLDVIESEGLVDNAAQRGKELIDCLRGLQSAYPGLIGDVRGRGLMCAIELNVDAGATRAILQAVEAEDLLLLPCGPLGNVVRWVPPLVVSSDQVVEGVAAFARGVARAGYLG